MIPSDKETVVSLTITTHQYHNWENKIHITMVKNNTLHLPNGHIVGYL